MKNSKSKKILQMTLLIIICTLPIIFISSCGGTNSFSCSACGSTNTYTPFYASGTETLIDYQSCVCPAGCIGFGCNTVCMPTECLYIEYNHSDSDDVTKGFTCYYDDFGCLDNENVMSSGTYTTSSSCLLLSSCSSDIYKEKITNNGVSASQSSSCLGCNVNSENVEPRNVNEAMPRKYPYGCYTMCHNSEE